MSFPARHAKARAGSPAETAWRWRCRSRCTGELIFTFHAQFCQSEDGPVTLIAVLRENLVRQGSGNKIGECCGKTYSGRSHEFPADLRTGTSETVSTATQEALTV